MKQSIILLSFILVFTTNNVYANFDLSKSGDILQIALPITSLGIALCKDDLLGQKEFLISVITTTALTHSLKSIFNNTSLGKRPRGGKNSFPSGHTSAAFQGAFFLQKRYGMNYGIPALGIAAFTGYTRVKGKYHYYRDVFAAAGLSYIVNDFLITKYQIKYINASIVAGGIILSINAPL